MAKKANQDNNKKEQVVLLLLVRSREVPQYTHLDLVVQRPVDKGHAVQCVRLESGPGNCRRIIPAPIAHVRLPRAHQQALRLFVFKSEKCVSLYLFQDWAVGSFFFIFVFNVGSSLLCRFCTVLPCAPTGYTRNSLSGPRYSSVLSKVQQAF